MSIVFHCEHCGKRVEAPETAGGKWGKCPACHNKVYIPTVQSEEEIRLAPLHNGDEKKRKEMLAETVRLRQDILSETEAPDEGTVPKKDANAAGAGSLSEAELTTSIIGYLRQMADGELERAERTARMIIGSGSKAGKILERIALSQIPEPELADIPQQVLVGLIKNLRSRLR